MADIHIIRGSASSGNFLKVVAHMDVSGSNQLPQPIAFSRLVIPYKFVAGGMGIPGRTILPPGDGSEGTISSSEAEQIALGNRLEFTFFVPLPEAATWSAMTNAEKAQLIRDKRSLEVARIITEMSGALDYAGIGIT